MCTLDINKLLIKRFPFPFVHMVPVSLHSVAQLSAQTDPGRDCCLSLQNWLVVKPESFNSVHCECGLDDGQAEHIGSSPVALNRSNNSSACNVNLCVPSVELSSLELKNVQRHKSLEEFTIDSGAEETVTSQ
jgi:hypothetical protein